MADFQFLKNPISQKWVVLAPRRAKRPDVAKGTEPVCPFCPGRETEEKELYRVRKSEIQSTKPQTNPNDQKINDKKSFEHSDSGIVSSFDDTSKKVVPLRYIRDSNLGNDDWLIRVLPNKFPFAPIHEVIVHSPDHQQDVASMPLEHLVLLIQTYRQRYQTHQEKGQVYIFHNRGIAAGESLPHAHSQLAVIPHEVVMHTPRLDPFAHFGFGPKPLSLTSTTHGIEKEEMVETQHFYLFCPRTSQWPDEVWVAPKNRGRAFGEITDDEIADFAFVLQRLLSILTIRHEDEFPFNYYIYPGGDWYLRIIPRLKILGGFEVGTGIFVNTQDPHETMAFLKAHFQNPKEETIKKEHRALYHKAV